MAQQSVFSLFKIKKKMQATLNAAQENSPKKYPQSLFTFHTGRHLHYDRQRTAAWFSPAKVLIETLRVKERYKKTEQQHKIIHSSLNVTPLESKSPEHHSLQSPGIVKVTSSLQETISTLSSRLRDVRGLDQGSPLKRL